MNEIRESLLAVNMVSLAAARQSLKHYADYIRSAYLDKPGFVERLDLLDESPEKYWSKMKKCKKCEKQLPDGYKRNMCENCIGKKAKKVRSLLEVALSVALVIGGTMVKIATKGRTDPPKGRCVKFYVKSYHQENDMYYREIFTFSP